MVPVVPLELEPRLQRLIIAAVGGQQLINLISLPVRNAIQIDFLFELCLQLCQLAVLLHFFPLDGDHPVHVTFLAVPLQLHLVAVQLHHVALLFCHLQLVSVAVFLDVVGFDLLL